MTPDSIRTDESTPRPTTLLMLVQELSDQIDSPDDVAIEASRLTREREVVLTGNFAGRPILLPAAG